jgi:nitrite reductase/ring-hydroxylating ferredoxin subunit
METQQVRVGSFSSFADGDYKIFVVGKQEVGVFRIGDRLVAYENICPHAGGPVCQGKVFNRVEEILTDEKKSEGLRFAGERHVICPWHGYEFNLETGCHPADKKIRLKPVPVELRGDQIYLNVRAPADATL